MFKRLALVGCVCLLGCALYGRNARAAEILDNAKLRDLLKAKISLGVIEEMIKASNTDFRCDTKEVVEISKAATEGGMPQSDIDKLLKILIAESNRSQTRLRDLVSRFMNMCVNGNEQEYAAMMRTLLREGPAAVPYLLEKIEQENERMRVGLLDALGQIGDKSDRVVQSVKLMVNDREKSVRAQAAKAVALLAGPKTCAELIEDLNPKKHEHLDGYALALGHLGDKNAVVPLVTLLKDTTDEDTAVCAAFSLGLLRANDERTVGALLDSILSDRWEMLRYTSAKSLALVGEPRTVSYVIRAFQRYREGRAHLVSTLSKFKYFEAIEFLVNCTNDDNNNVRKSAMETLQVVTGERYDNYDDWYSWWNINKVRPDWERIGKDAKAGMNPKAAETLVQQPDTAK
ncbi:MAG: HEAT repeat domain-containing protein [Planctomycetota bacterium]|nr:HEAT repeat domain-containing protein [Planctomycetota bacterium]